MDLILWRHAEANELVEPARRTEQTVQALGREYELRTELAPDASVEQLLTLAGWPDARLPVLLVGHQPTLGQTLANT
jgi:phosphohistidine phosphatase